jgi:hypothetical protein
MEERQPDEQGMRFSLVYLNKGMPSKDSQRFRMV